MRLPGDVATHMMGADFTAPYPQRCAFTPISTHNNQGSVIQPESSCIVYYTYYIILCIILCIIFTYDFKTIRPKSNSIIHNTQYNTYYVLIRIMYCHTLSLAR